MAAMVEKQDTCSDWLWLSKEQLSRSVREAPVAVALPVALVVSKSGGRETEEGELGSW